MATNSKAMEDWFLRGGERPQENGMQQAPVVICQNCGGDNLADEEYCTHCGAALTGGTSTEEYCGSEHGENPCDECDGLTRCDDCPHNCGDDDDGYDACEECEDHSMCDKCHHVEGEPDDGEKAEYTVAVKYWRKVRYEAFVDVEADNPADAVAQAREMYEDMDLDPEEIDSEDFGEPEFEVDP